MRRGAVSRFLVRSMAFEKSSPIVVLARSPSSATFGMMSAAAFENFDRIIRAASISSLDSTCGAAASDFDGAGAACGPGSGVMFGSSAGALDTAMLGRDGTRIAASEVTSS